MSKIPLYADKSFAVPLFLSLALHPTLLVVVAPAQSQEREATCQGFSVSVEKKKHRPNIWEGLEETHKTVIIVGVDKTIRIILPNMGPLLFLWMTASPLP